MWYEKRLIILLAALVLLALVFRVYKLWEIPVGFHVDEARVGWNAYSIEKTGRDDHGNRFALYYNTFGDYRPTGIFYITIPSLMLFGRNEFAVRLPSALLGALSIIPLFLLVYELGITMPPKKRWLFALGSTAALAFSPWHISVSRATSEVAISLFFILWGLYTFLRFIHSGSRNYAALALAGFVISYFFYHSARVIDPLFAGVLLLFNWNQLKVKSVKKFGVAIVIILIALTGFLTISKEAQGRFSQVSIFNDLDVQDELSRMPFEEGANSVFLARIFHNKPSVYARRFMKEYANYFGADFLVGDKAKPNRYMTYGVGLITYAELLLIVLGVFVIIKKNYSLRPILLLAISPLPAALTTEDAPNLHRSFAMVIFFALLVGYGVVYSLDIARWGKAIFLGLAGLFIVNFLFFIHMYIVHTRVHFPMYRNIGAKELALELNKLQASYDKIVLTDIPDDPYPWIAFFTGKDPVQFNKDAVNRDQGVWQSENFVFTSQRCPSRDSFEKPDVKRLLVVDAEGCESESNLKKRQDVKIIDQVKRTDNSVVYTLWSRIEE